MSLSTFPTGLRAALFGVLTWWLVLCLLEFWSAVVGMEGTYGWYFETDVFDYFAFSPPDLESDIRLITGGAGVITFLWMLSLGRAPGWRWLSVASLAVGLITSCLRAGTHAAVRSTLYFGPCDVSIFHNRYPAIPIIAVECAVIFGILWSWAQKAGAAALATGGESGERGAVPSAREKRVSPQRIALLSLTVVLLVAGCILMARSSFEKSVVSEERHRALNLEAIKKSERPRVWLYAASDLVDARNAAGDYDGAAEILQEMLALEESLYGPESRNVANRSLKIAQALVRGHQPASADPWFRRYLAYSESNNFRDQYIDEARRTVAKYFRDQGKFDDARALYEKVITRTVKNAPPRERDKIPEWLAKEYRDLLTKMGQSPEAIQKQLDGLTSPVP